jgi:hypothetical protein
VLVTTRLLTLNTYLRCVVSRDRQVPVWARLAGRSHLSAYLFTINVLGDFNRVRRPLPTPYMGTGADYPIHVRVCDSKCSYEAVHADRMNN